MLQQISKFRLPFVKLNGVHCKYLSPFCLSIIHWWTFGFFSLPWGFVASIVLSYIVTSALCPFAPSLWGEKAPECQDRYLCSTWNIYNSLSKSICWHSSVYFRLLLCRERTDSDSLTPQGIDKTECPGVGTGVSWSPHWDKEMHSSWCRASPGLTSTWCFVGSFLLVSHSFPSV